MIRVACRAIQPLSHHPFSLFHFLLLSLKQPELDKNQVDRNSNDPEEHLLDIKPRRFAQRTFLVAFHPINKRFPPEYELCQLKGKLIDRPGTLGHPGNIDLFPFGLYQSHSAPPSWPCGFPRMCSVTRAIECSPRTVTDQGPGPLSSGRDRVREAYQHRPIN